MLKTLKRIRAVCLKHQSMFVVMPKRTTVTLPDHIIPELEAWAKTRGQGFATVCTLAIELGVKRAKETGEMPATAKAASHPEQTTESKSND